MRTAIEPLRLRSSCAHCEQIPVMSTYVTVLIDCAPSYPIDSYVWLIALCRGSLIGKNKGSEVYTKQIFPHGWPKLAIFAKRMW